MMAPTSDRHFSVFPAPSEHHPESPAVELISAPWSSGSSLTSVEKASHGTKDCELESQSNWTDSGHLSSRDGDPEKNFMKGPIPTLNASDISLQEGQQATDSGAPMTTRQQLAFIFITCIAQLLSLCALNQTVAPVMVLARYFHIDNYGDLSWFSAAYSMTVGTFILPAGMFSTFMVHNDYGHQICE